MPAATTRIRAAHDALALASLQRDGRAWLVVASPMALPADPRTAFAAAPERRTLLWNDQEWLLASGVAAEIRCDGPGRGSHLAQEAARLEARCVIAHLPPAQAGLPPPTSIPSLPCLLAALSFEETAPTAPASADTATSWGADLPGARLWLPQRLHWRQADGSGWRISAQAVSAGQDTPESILAALEAVAPQPAGRPLSQWTPPARDYTELVEEAVALIRDGALRKVVLARRSDEDLPEEVRPEQVLSRLVDLDQGASTVYAHDLDNGALFLGSSPELLFAGNGTQVETMALAGTSSRGQNAAEDHDLGAALMACTKQRKEHGVVVEHLVSVLRQRCLPFTVPSAPHLRHLGRLIHLETVLSVRLRRPDYLELLTALHPTPAVCGLPTATAAHFIARHEGLQRGLYAGALGWLTPQRCRFIVPLRGGILAARRARLFAGAGIIETSEAAEELAETELKFSVMRQALGLATHGQGRSARTEGSSP